MIFKSPGGGGGGGDTQDHSGNSEISAFYGSKISNAILPFLCNFHHNSLGAKYFGTKRVKTVNHLVHIR